MMLRRFLSVLVVLALAAGVFFAWPRLEGAAPQITAPPSLDVGAAGTPLAIDVADAGSGVARVEVRIQHPGGTRELAVRDFTGSRLRGGGPTAERVEIVLSPRELGLADGAATILISARDWSWRDAFSGNRGEASVALRIDTKPPRVSVETGLTYVQRGGAAVAIYRLDEPAALDGVRVGEAFFPGHPHPAESDPLARIALFAVPVESPIDPPISVEAADMAGNTTRVGFPARVLERAFPRGEVRLPPGFLERVAVPLAASAGLTGADPVESFKRVNRELRARNEAQVRDATASSSDRPYFKGQAFQQWANSQVTSRFAEQRVYLADGVPVSDARHYGFDLAATAAAPVTASQAGIVVHAGDLGIYGQCVILDHGLGLATLYGHLSAIQVAVGDAVEAGGLLGRSGATGLAGGDHLHFAIILAGQYVDPLEWWDAEWVRTHVAVHLEPRAAAGAEAASP